MGWLKCRALIWVVVRVKALLWVRVMVRVMVMVSKMFGSRYVKFWEYF